MPLELQYRNRRDVFQVRSPSTIGSCSSPRTTPYPRFISTSPRTIRQLHDGTVEKRGRCRNCLACNSLKKRCHANHSDEGSRCAAEFSEEEAITRKNVASRAPMAGCCTRGDRSRQDDCLTAFNFRLRVLFGCPAAFGLDRPRRFGQSTMLLGWDSRIFTAMRRR